MCFVPQSWPHEFLLFRNDVRWILWHSTLMVVSLYWDHCLYPNDEFSSSISNWAENKMNRTDLTSGFSYLLFVRPYIPWEILKCNTLDSLFNPCHIGVRKERTAGLEEGRNEIGRSVRLTHSHLEGWVSLCHHRLSKRQETEWVSRIATTLSLQLLDRLWTCLLKKRTKNLQLQHKLMKGPRSIPKVIRKWSPDDLPSLSLCIDSIPAPGKHDLLGALTKSPWRKLLIS